MQRRNLPYRKSIRLKGWNYRNPGLYYVTICTNNRKQHFGEIRNGIMGLSVPGCVANYYWTQITNQFHSVELDEYVVMPNHIHGIIAITGRVAIHGDHYNGNKNVTGFGRDESRPHNSKNDIDEHARNPKKNKGGVTKEHNPMLYDIHLGRIIRWFKGRCTYEIRNKRNYSRFAWQSRFHDHIIKNEQSLNRIRKYIRDNPLRWDVDRNNPLC